MYDLIIKTLEDIRLYLWWKLHGTWIEALYREVTFWLPWLFVVTCLSLMLVGPDVAALYGVYVFLKGLL